MANLSALTSLLLLLLLFVSPSVKGNSSPDCSALVLNMASCLPFVMIGSTVDKPEDSCCLGLKKVIDTNAVCLCDVLKNSGSMGIKVNVTKASTLPAACKLTTPPISACGLPTPPPPPPLAANTPGSPVPTAGPKPGPVSAPAPGPSKNHGSSLIPISGLSFVISGALVILFSLV